MTHGSRFLVGLLILFWVGQACAQGKFASFLEERQRSVVFVDYFVQREEDRQPAEAVGLVVSAEGLVVLLSTAFPEWLPPDTFRDIRVHLPNSRGEGFPGRYLGPDAVNGWHYVQIEDLPREGVTLVPITDWGTGSPRVGEELWGIGLTDGNLDHLAYFMSARLSAAQNLPLRMGFTTREVSVPGGPVFDGRGRFVGWAGMALPVERDVWFSNDYFRIRMRNPDESNVFLFADELVGNLNRVPSSPWEDQRAWLGVVGLRPIDPETAKFLGLVDQGALVVSEVLPESPAAEAGLRDRDIIVRLEGQPLPRLKPDQVVQSFFERELRRRDPGDELEFQVIRGEERLDLEVTLGEGPKSLRTAERIFLQPLAVGVRELVLSDAIGRRRRFEDMAGVVVTYVRANSAAATAGLQVGDWIQELDGQPLSSFAEAKERFEALAASDREEYVLLINRNNDTSVLRVRRR